MATVSERLENGDYGFNQKTGEIFRKPVNLRDAHKVTVDMIDKRNLLNGKQSQQTADLEIGSKLDFLAKKFAEFANMTKGDLTRELNKDVVIDVESTSEGN